MDNQNINNAQTQVPPQANVNDAAAQAPQQPVQPAAQTNSQQTPYMPVSQLKTNRGLAKFILLSLITFGIYGLVVMCGVVTDLNIIASRYDGKKTTNYLLMSLILTPLTLGIYTFVWYHKISNRVGEELVRRGISYTFSASDYWLWNILGSLIIVGPFVYLYKMFKALNLLSEDYNMRG